MFAKDFDQLTLADINYLVENRVSEGRQFEFKRDHYGRKDEDKREFAADVRAGSGKLDSRDKWNFCLRSA